jgi:hypothetical protein
MPRDISLHHRVYHLANNAKEFCPTCKLKTESPSDGISRQPVVAGKMSVTNPNVVLLASRGDSEAERVAGR